MSKQCAVLHFAQLCMYLHTGFGLRNFIIPPESAMLLASMQIPTPECCRKMKHPCGMARFSGSMLSSGRVYIESCWHVMRTQWAIGQTHKPPKIHLDIWTFGGDCYWLVSSHWHCMKFPLTCKISTTRKRLVNASPEKEKLTYRISWR